METKLSSSNVAAPTAAAKVSRKQRRASTGAGRVSSANRAAILIQFFSACQPLEAEAFRVVFQRLRASSPSVLEPSNPDWQAVNLFLSTGTKQLKRRGDIIEMRQRNSQHLLDLLEPYLDKKQLMQAYRTLAVVSNDMTVIRAQVVNNSGKAAG